MIRRNFLKLAAGALAVAGGHGIAQAAPQAMDAKAWHAARRFAATPFGRVAYVELGSGPAALFLHGFPLNGFQWRGAMAMLASQRRCIAPDVLGLGYSEPAPGQNLAPAAQVQMLLALLDGLGVGQVDVIANDSGGAIGQLLLATHPERVRSLLLTNCDTEPECPPPAMGEVIRLAHAGQFASAWLAPWLVDKDAARGPKALGGICFADPRNPTDEAIDMYLRPLVEHQERTNAYAIALERNFLAGLTPALKASKAPVRIVWGLADSIFSKAGLQHLAANVGQLHGVRELAESKLFWPEERPEVIAQEALLLWKA